MPLFSSCAEALIGELEAAVPYVPYVPYTFGIPLQIGDFLNEPQTVVPNCKMKSKRQK